MKLSQKNNFSKILLITAKRVGDALFCTQGIRIVKQTLPDTKFDVLVLSKNVAEVFRYNPDINQIHISSSPLKIRQLAKQYPLCINLMHEMLKYLNNMPEPFLSIDEPDESKHRVDQVVEFVTSILETPAKYQNKDYAIFPQGEDDEKIKQLLQNAGAKVGDDILIGCQLGCHRVARRGWKFWNKKRHVHKKVWPIENYIELAGRLMQENPRVRFVLTGSPAERYLAKLFLSRFPRAISLIGKTSLLEVTALMDHLNVYVTHDTGNMHLACARKTNLVALFAATPVAFTGPYPKQSQFKVIQKEMIGDITVDEVYDEVINLQPSITANT